MIRFFAVLLPGVLFVGSCEAQLPKFLKEERLQFSCEDFAEAVNYLVAKGETSAMEELLIVARQTSPSSKMAENICLLCRILFLSKSEPIRPPRNGMRDLPVETMPLASWPNYPLVKLNSCILLMGDRGDTTGVPESPETYLRFCLQNGRFLTQPLPLPNRQAALEDLESLLKSERWKSIKWGAGNQNIAIRLMRSQASQIKAP